MAADDVKFCTKLVHGGSLEDHDGTTCVYISIYLDVHIHIYIIYTYIYTIYNIHISCVYLVVAFGCEGPFYY